MAPLKTALFVLLLISTPIHAWAESSDQRMDVMHFMRDVEHARLDSAILGRPLHLLVKVPAGAADCPDCRYPTVFLLDGGATFPAAAGYLNYLRFENAVPEIILVGIAYSGESFEEGNYRSTDYTAPSEERDFWGGAEDFQNVLASEIFPRIAANYPMDDNRRIIFGQSIGGQFVLYTAMTNPGLFYGHIASNPALHRNLELFLENKNPEGNTRLFVAGGSEDSPRFKPHWEQWMSHWQNAAHPSFELETRVLEGYGHFSILTESFRQGLIWLLPPEPQ